MSGNNSSKRFTTPRPHTVAGSDPSRRVPKNTPVTRKISSNPRPTVKNNLPTIKGKLVDELNGHISNDMTTLVEHVFPDAALPAPLDVIFDKLATGADCSYSREHQRWTGCPVLTIQSNQFGDQEIALADWLNGLADKIGGIVTRECTRIVTGDFASNSKTLPGGPGNRRRPDVLIFDKGARHAWETVISHWELKNGPQHKGAARWIAAEGVRLIYESQDNRRFIPSLSILGDNCVFHIFDRVGHMYSEMFNIHEDYLPFLRIFTAIMFSDKEYLGYDPSIIALKDGRRAVTVKGKSYVIEERVYKSHSIIGRGTSCWRATRNGTTYAIKDYWTDTTRQSTEAEFLKAAHDAGVEGVCKLIDEEILSFRGLEDTTALIRPAEQAKKSKRKYPVQDHRVHRRLVLQPFAVSIVHFKTMRELIGAFIHVIRAHKDLIEKVGILHRDISANNMMLVAADPTSGERRGLLIDLDYAIWYSEGDEEQGKERKSANAERTGTTPFMALKLLSSGGKVSHKPEWDLESFFYVLIWVCILYDGPNNSEREVPFKDTPLYDWTEGSFEQVGKAKAGSVQNDDFWSITLDWVSPYFEDLKPCLEQWRDLLFKSGTPVTHDKVITILQETYKALPEEETPVNLPPVAQGEGEEPTNAPSVTPGEGEETTTALPAGDAEEPTSAVRQYRTGSYLANPYEKRNSDGEAEGEAEGAFGEESSEMLEGDQASGDDDDVPQEGLSSEAEDDQSDSFDFPVAGPSHSGIQVSSTGSRGRKRTHKEAQEDDDGYTESGIFPESQNAGWRSDAFTFHSARPSSSASWTTSGNRREEPSPTFSGSQRRGPTSSEGKRRRG